MAPTCPSCGGAFDGATFCPKDGSRLVTEAGADGRVGHTIADRYRLLSKVGAGAVGEVYEAEHLHIHKRVALKLLRSEVASDPNVVQRFELEARATSAIGHENIVQIEDFGRSRDGVVFLAMEWLEGETLQSLMNRETLSSALALQIASESCAGLSAAHAAGVVHRDLKPANIFLKHHHGSVQVKILDFGIAKLISGSSSLTSTGTFVGTPNYMAPEQAMDGNVDGRADLYSLGVVLYEMFTGQLPFSSESPVGVLHQHASQVPVSPELIARERGLSIPLDVVALIMRCLEKLPAARFASAIDMLAVIEAIRQNPGNGLPDGGRAESLEAGASASLDLRAIQRRSALFYLVPLMLIGSLGLALVLLLGDSESSAVAVDAGPIVIPTLPGIDAATTDVIDAAMAEDVWLHEWRDGLGRYSVIVAPAIGNPGESIRFQLRVRLESTVHPPETLSAKIDFSYFRDHEAGGDASGQLNGNGALNFENVFKQRGKYHATVVLSSGEVELGRTRFDICIGADPSTPSHQLTKLCPRMNPDSAEQTH